MKAFIVGTALVLAAALMAQDAPPQQEAPQADGPTLKDTMKFIQEKLAGRVNYVVYGHDNITNSDSTPLKRSFLLNNVVADASRCSIGFHSMFDNGKGGNIIEKDDEIFLKWEVKEIATRSMDEVLQQGNAKSDHPELSVKVDPPIFVVAVKRENHSMMFNFYEQALSERVARAMQYAVNLCGGEKQQEPF
jgi:hypothetical protein